MIPQQQREKLADYVYKFRVLASRHSFTLIYVWAGLAIAGLGLLEYKRRTGRKFRFTSEDMQSNPEISSKMLKWIEKLGLDQTVDKPPKR